MRGSGNLGRALLVVLGGLMVLGGLAAVADGGASAAPAGGWLVVVGMVFIAVAALERLRYRSESAERSSMP
ncbi:MAG TPA: hypothetical protein VFW02_09890, partial [Candidatus Limnocylindrales bacterium]|nr:hypothetical protein [Candidatus Limnocylindrales bacterium]